MDYAWSTHQPLIKAVLKAYDPQFILELGIGYFSTPLFRKHECEKMFIENEKAWIDKTGIDAIWHELPVKSQDVPVHDVSAEVKRAIFNYYQDLKEKLLLKPHPSLLFVDNYSCCRAIAINNLFPVFDIILYHDSEPQSIGRNDYYFVDKIEKDFDHFNLETPKTWTSAFVSKRLKPVQLISIAQQFIREYEIEHGISGLKLVKTS